jgi:glycosyltransferase involved in cell wall biosynthesis
MSSIYQQSTIFVLTSEHEGTPNVLLEAMASGLPVVATRVGGVPEIVQHGCTGFLAAKDEINELTSAILALARNPQLAIEMGARARAYIEQTHSVHQLPAHLADLYDLASGIRQGTQHEPRFSRALANDAV